MVVKIWITLKAHQYLFVKEFHWTLLALPFKAMLPTCSTWLSLCSTRRSALINTERAKESKLVLGFPFWFKPEHSPLIWQAKLSHGCHQSKWEMCLRRHSLGIAWSSQLQGWKKIWFPRPSFLLSPVSFWCNVQSRMAAKANQRKY